MGKKRNMSMVDKDDAQFISEKKHPIKPQPIYVNQTKALQYKIDLKCKNQKQKEYAKLIKEKDITFCTGECGTGKSWVALAMALDLLKNDDRYDRILIITPTCEAGNMNIGLLPGDKNEKISVYLDADHYTMTKILNESDNVGKIIVHDLISTGLLEGDNISFLRGKTIDRSIVIITEAENFNKQEMFLILSRIGSSKYIFNGDIKQLDRKDIRAKKEKSGLEYAMEVFKGMPEIGLCHFTKEDIVRNPIISKIMDRWFGESENL